MCLTSTKHIEDFTPEMYKQVVDALKSKGCQNLDDWKESRIDRKMTAMVSKDVESGIETGDIGTAVSMVDKFMSSYDDAVQMSTEFLSEENPKSMRWVINSGEMREADSSLIYLLQDLEKIDKKSMTERAFYERVLDEVSMGLNPMISREGHDELKRALRDKGVQTIDEWKKEGDITPERQVNKIYRDKGSYRGSIDEGVRQVSGLLGDYESARLTFSYYRTDFGRMQVREWLEDSKEVSEKQEVMTNIVRKMGIRKAKRILLEDIKYTNREKRYKEQADEVK